MPRLVEQISADQESLETLIADFRRAGAPAHMTSEVLCRLVDEVDDHANAMAEVVLPIVIQQLPDGPEIAAAEGELLDDLEDAVMRIRRAVPDDRSAPPAVRIPVEDLGEYVTRWRARILPELRQVIPAEADEELAAAYVRAKHDAREAR